MPFSTRRRRPPPSGDDPSPCHRRSPFPYPGLSCWDSWHRPSREWRVGSRTRSRLRPPPCPEPPTQWLTRPGPTSPRACRGGPPCVSKPSSPIRPGVHRRPSWLPPRRRMAGGAGTTSNRSWPITRGWILSSKGAPGRSWRGRRSSGPTTPQRSATPVEPRPRSMLPIGPTGWSCWRGPTSGSDSPTVQPRPIARRPTSCRSSRNGCCSAQPG